MLITQMIFERTWML